MSDKRRCKCGMTHFADEPCPSCSGEILPSGAYDPPPQEPILYQQTTIRQRLPRYDPLMQEAEDDLAKRHGREAARQMIDEEENR